MTHSHHIPTTRGAGAVAAASAITPELCAWIIAQAQANVAAPALLQSMQAAGWDEDVALTALQTTLREHLDEVAAQRGMPPAVPVPTPALHDSPTRLAVADRSIDVLLSMANPRLAVFGNLLSGDECEALIAAARPRMARSLTVASNSATEEVNDDRTSDGMFFERGEIPLVQALEERIAQLLHWPIENGEGLQVLRYLPGAQYKPHYDYFDPAEPSTTRILRRGGQRVATLVMYLNTPAQGGGTTFPDVHLEVAPQRGNAVFFSYERPHPSTRTLHGGAPVLAGEKWVATKWLREREFT